MAEQPGLRRMTIQVEEQLFIDFNKVVQHGFRRHLMEKLIRLAMESIERDGPIMLGALISGEFKLVRDEAPAREAV